MQGWVGGQTWGGGVSTQAAVSTGSANLPVTRLVLLAPRGLALG